MRDVEAHRAQGLRGLLCRLLEPAAVHVRRLLGVAGSLLVLFSVVTVLGGESWQTAFAGMPLDRPVNELNRSNCVPLMLQAFQSNQAVKALVFMPGATDEFYMFRRARAVLTNEHPSLLNAVSALTNQTLIRATFQPPFLLLHTDEDPLELLSHVDHQPTADKLKRRLFLPHILVDDRDWDFMQPLLKKRLRLDIRPWRHSYESWHFYRHSFAGWGLNEWEALEATALAGKTSFDVQRHRVIFQGDERVRATPKFETFPR